MRAYPLRPVALRRLVAMLPPRSLISLGAAIFTLFSSMGFLTDVMAGGTHPRALVAANVLFSGTIALVYAYSAMWNWKIFPIALALHLAYSALVRNVFGTPPAPV